jgi:hypothetical protein
VPDFMKYAVVERERRYLLASLPADLTDPVRIIDRYVIGTRLRLRELTEPDGHVVRKFTHKVRLKEGPAEIASTNFYLDEGEWSLLFTLPARSLRKTRYIVDRDGLQVAIDEYPDGTLVAEIDDGESPPRDLPEWLDVVEDVTNDERWTGAHLARA